MMLSRERRKNAFDSTLGGGGGGGKRKKITQSNDNLLEEIEDGTMATRNPGQVARWFSSRRKGCEPISRSGTFHTGGLTLLHRDYTRSSDPESSSPLRSHAK